MTRRVAWALGAVVAVGAVVGTAALSRAPLAAYPSDTPILRLAWSVRPERIEHCRTLTDEELADVPAHMRQRVQCEGRSAGYRLGVSPHCVAGCDGWVRVAGGGADIAGGHRSLDRPGTDRVHANVRSQLHRHRFGQRHDPALGCDVGDAPRTGRH